MAELIPFVPRDDLAAKKNMEAFVKFCREEIASFGAELDFNSTTWDVTDFYQMRGMNYRLLLNFVDDAPQRGVLGSPMPEPFACQAKAYIRYHAALCRKKSPPYAEVAAFRALLAAFRSKAITADLTSIDTQLLDHAVELAATRKAGDHGARTGVHLGPISKFLRENSLAPYAPIEWKHGRQWHRQKWGRTDQQARERREKFLPSHEALNALTEAFRIAKDPRDVIATAVMALLVCAPSRINEVFALAHDCELRPLTEGEEGYMLRWAGSKGYHDFAKGIPAVMADVAKEALVRLRTQTAEARSIANWYQKHPGQLYLPEDCVSLRGRNLTAVDLSRIIGFDDSSGALTWARSNNIAPDETIVTVKGRKAYTFHFADVERAILTFLPRGFPIHDKSTGLQSSDALLVVRRSEFDSRRHMRWRCMFEPVKYNQIQNSFHHADGVFARLGLSSSERPIILRTNQLRHYLNTLAQRGGLSEMEIAAWSGRKDVRQNADYDHRTPEEKLERKRRRDGELTKIAGGAAKINQPVTRAEAAARSAHGHATEIGFCEHDFAASPCAMFMECINCTKHVCIKGHDPKHLERVGLALASARNSLAKAEQARAEEYEGAEEWIKAHRETVERLEQLHTILSDPTLPDGSLIRLAKSGRYSLVEQAMRDHEVVTNVLLPWNSPRTLTVKVGSNDA